MHCTAQKWLSGFTPERIGFGPPRTAPSADRVTDCSLSSRTARSLLTAEILADAQYLKALHQLRPGERL